VRDPRGGVEKEKRRPEEDALKTGDLLCVTSGTVAGSEKWDFDWGSFAEGKRGGRSQPKKRGDLEILEFLLMDESRGVRGGRNPSLKSSKGERG